MTYDKTEMNAFVQNLYDQKMQEGKHGHYETMFNVVHAAIAAYQAKLIAGAEMPESSYYDVEMQIIGRYRVEPTKGGFWPASVKCGTGTGDVFVGSKKQAEHVRQALQSACLDGAFIASNAAIAKTQQYAAAAAAQAREKALDEAKDVCEGVAKGYSAYRDHWNHRDGATNCAAAIEKLKGGE